jgi:mono/diheme cytochrome c family protein
MRKALSSTLVAAVVVLVFLVAPAGVRLAQGKVVGPPEVAWKELTYEQKRAYMKGAVVPKMKPIFQAFDAKKFKNVTCQTCHGDDGPERKYKMPSNGIHPLPNTKEAFEAKLKAEPTWPKWTEFMTQKVEPAMGKLLAIPVFDPKKPVEGALSCANCHKLEAAKR